MALVALKYVKYATLTINLGMTHFGPSQPYVCSSANSSDNIKKRLNPKFSPYAILLWAME